MPFFDTIAIRWEHKALRMAMGPPAPFIFMVYIIALLVNNSDYLLVFCQRDSELSDSVFFGATPKCPIVLHVKFGYDQANRATI